MSACSGATGRDKGLCLLAGSSGTGKPAAWLGFCLGGYLRVFSRVCQSWPPPCFHKCPLQKELVVLIVECNEHREVSPWKLRWAEQPQGKLSSENLGTATFPPHAQGKRSLAASCAQWDAATQLDRGDWNAGNISLARALDVVSCKDCGPTLCGTNLVGNHGPNLKTRNTHEIQMGCLFWGFWCQ